MKSTCARVDEICTFPMASSAVRMATETKVYVGQARWSEPVSVSEFDGNNYSLIAWRRGQSKGYPDWGHGYVGVKNQDKIPVYAHAPPPLRGGRPTRKTIETRLSFNFTPHKYHTKFRKVSQSPSLCARTVLNPVALYATRVTRCIIRKNV